MDFKITAVLLLNCLVTCTAQSTTATYRNVSSPCIKFDYKCDPETGLCSQVLAVTTESLAECNCTNFDEEISRLRAQLEELSEGGCKVTDDQKTTTVATTVSGPYRDCDELLQSDPTMVSGVYEVTPENYHTILVYCDVDGDEAWTVIQRRLDDTVYFGRPWSHYRHGFGPIDGTHWLGNEQIHYLTEQGRYKLHIDMVDVSDEHHVAKYDKFHVDSESTTIASKWATTMAQLVIPSRGRTTRENLALLTATTTKA
ncbi:ficolin-1-like [Ptychodera flava]|uniref:ficolin-1-like n=1 Tax=Ptychodera flava TaxID=63121 RepID=UPI00396A6244